MAYTFKGGTHFPDSKNTRGCRVEKLPSPETVAIPMSQHIGAPSRVTVGVGDYVYYGQMIGEGGAGLSCPVHASVSGEVLAIEDRVTSAGVLTKYAVIKNDMKYEPHPDIKPFPGRLGDTSPEEIVSIIKNAGIAGMGGAVFPTHAKVSSGIGKTDLVIINCAECEPYITVNHRLLLEEPTDVINGTKVLLKALGVRRAVIAVEDNKPDAIALLGKLLADSKMISVKVMKTKYPQGDERQLIYALTGREVPTGKLPADVGCVIFNCETVAAVFRAFASGMPLTDRRVTVDGDCIKSPRNVLAPIGATFSDLIEFAGGLTKTPRKIIVGGPMMGQAQWNTDGVVTKGTSALLVLSKEVSGESRLAPACIRCGLCVRNCPMHLMPNYLTMFAQKHDYERAEKWGTLGCVECGTCSYNCPGGVEIVQYIRVAKAAIKTEKARVAEAKAQAAADKK